MEDVAADRTPSCPRCGYDQRGVMHQWEDACPLEGVCAECGLRFQWAEIILPDKFAPRWLIEYRPGRLGALRAFPITVWRSMRPFRYWSRIDMSHHVRPRRLVAYVVLLLLLLTASFAIEQTVVAVQVRAQVAQDPAITTVSQSYAWAIIEAVCFPLAEDSRGTITTRQVSSYARPQSLHRILLTYRTKRVGYGSWVLHRAFTNGVISSGKSVGFHMAVGFLIPLGFFFLPASRLKSKVRSIHLMRICVYSLAIPIILCAAFWLACAISFIMTEWLVTATRLTTFMLAVLPVPFFVIWWAAAIGRYLRMPHAFWTAVLLTLAASLAVLVTTWLIAPETAVDAIEFIDPGFLRWGLGG